MKIFLRVFSFLAMCSIALPTWAQEAGGLDAKIDAIFRPIVDALGAVIFWQPLGFMVIPLPFVLIWLVA